MSVRSKSGRSKHTTRASARSALLLEIRYLSRNLSLAIKIESSCSTIGLIAEMGDTLATDDQTGPLSVARTLDFSQASVLPKMVEKQSAEDGEGCSEGVVTTEDDDSHNDADIKEVDCCSVKESSKKELDGAGLQGFLEVPQEFEPGSSVQVENEASQLFSEPTMDEQVKVGVLHTEDKNVSDLKNHTTIEQVSHANAQKSEGKVTKKCGLSAAYASKADLSSCSSLPRNSSKVMSRTKAEGLSIKKKISVENQDSDRADPPSSHTFRRSLSSGTMRSNFTVPQPFALATDKRASIGGRPVVGEAPLHSHEPRLSGRLGNSALKNIQVSKKASTKSGVIQSLHSESAKPLEDSPAKVNVPAELKVDDDELQSVSSVGSKASRVKVASATNTSGFSFKCDERAEKRKEFYTKLEEMHIAKQEERNQIQAKTKEEMENEIKQLRKSLTFKATPMPAFYHEGVPPKAELKKIPTTRAKSPKFCRRASSGALDSEGSNGRSCRVNYLELELEISSNDSMQKSADENIEKGSGKSSIENSKKPVRRSLSKFTSEKLPKAKSPGNTQGPKFDATCPAKIAVPSGNGTGSIKARESSEMGDASSINPTEEGIGEHPHEIKDEQSEHRDDEDGTEECMHENMNGSMEATMKSSVEREDACYVRVVLAPESDIGAAPESADASVKDSDSTSSKNMSKGDRPKAVSDLSSGTKAKAGRSLQQASKEENHDSKANKTVKRERLKASTPAFRRRENVGNGSLKCAIKSDLETSTGSADKSVN